eukprot:TRINITY_DN75446_c0_g1_i1.p1 TRINITY_DN75446_c0_g1~~TRINITY_DN75446_c0_g1_i1.p1  ORF type:complete len:660 (+),score=79.48 TRINITY_DN75446_c0_g1_i1:94-2073(+)
MESAAAVSRPSMLASCCRSRRAPMHMAETLFMNPFDKWTYHGRFPCKFFLHVLLAALVTAQACILFNRDVEHVARTSQHFDYLLGGDKTLHSPSAIQDALNRTIGNHFLTNNLSIVKYVLRDPSELKVKVLLRNGQTLDRSIDRENYTSSVRNSRENEYLGSVLPHMYDLELIPRVATIRMFHHLHEMAYAETGFECTYHWEMESLFDGSYAGMFLLRFALAAKDCKGQHWHVVHALPMTVATLAVISAVLMLRKLVTSAKATRGLLSDARARANLSTYDLISMLSMWWVVAITSNLVQIMSSCMCCQSQPDITSRFQWVGFSCFLTWVNVIQYFESFPGYFIAFNTMSRSFFKIMQYLFSVAPLFLAFILLGVCLFFQSPNFASPLAATAMLFSLMNGDSVRDVFVEIHRIGGWFAQIYLYSFLLLFIYVVLNINISIVTDAYHIEKHRHHNHEESRREELLEHVRNALHEGKPEVAGALLGCSVDCNTALELGGSADSQTTQQARARSSGLSPLLRAALPPQTGTCMSPRLLRNPGLQEHLARVFPGSRSCSEGASRARSRMEGAIALLSPTDEGPLPSELPEGAQDASASTPSCPPTAGSSFELKSMPWTDFDHHLDGLVAATRKLALSDDMSAMDLAIQEIQRARARAVGHQSLR